MKKLKLEELDRLSVESFRTAEKLPVSLVLDNVRSLHNVGSAFRTADAFRLEKIYLTGITGTPPHREIQKTALGATESVEWLYVDTAEEVVRALRAENYIALAIEQTTRSVPLKDYRLVAQRSYCLVFGNEVNGISEGVIGTVDDALEIPQFGTKHSLNVSVCIGIVAWEFFKKLWP